MLLRCDLIAKLCCSRAQAIVHVYSLFTKWFNVYRPVTRWWELSTARFGNRAVCFQNRTNKWGKRRKPKEDKGQPKQEILHNNNIIFIIVTLARPRETFNPASLPVVWRNKRGGWIKSFYSSILRKEKWIFRKRSFTRLASCIFKHARRP